MSKKCPKFEENRQSENDYFRIQPYNPLKNRKKLKWGVKGKTIEKAIVFFLALFSIEGCILGKQRRYEENKHYGCVQSSRTVGIAS